MEKKCLLIPKEILCNEDCIICLDSTCWDGLVKKEYLLKKKKKKKKLEEEKKK